jgi:hypothetical protein
MFEGFTNVSEPDTNNNVKKLPVEQSSDAVRELIDKASTSPLTELLNTAFWVTAAKLKNEAV